MNLNDYLLKDYIINASDILYLTKTKTIKKLLKKISNSYINTKSKKLHTNKIKHIENFIFLLDQYILLIKQNIFIDPLDIRFLIELSIDNNLNKTFLKKTYYLDNKDYYINKFKKLFIHNYIKNQTKIKKIVNNLQVINNFEELSNLINKNKDLYYLLFEKITNKNVNNKAYLWTNINY